MYCPNCGTQVSTEQKFCRACGLEVQGIARQMAQLQAGNAAAEPGLPNTVWRYRLMFAGVCVMLSGLVLLMINSLLHINRIINLPSVLLLMIGALLTLYGELAPKLHAPPQPRRTPQPTELPAAETTSKLALAAGAEPVMSVTEHTTRTLAPVAAKSGDLA